MTLSFSVAAANAQATALASAIGPDPTIQIRSGPKPASPETTATGSLLATIEITGSFTATDEVIAAADPGAVPPTGDGSAGHFRVLTSGGVAVIDGAITETGGDGDMTMGSTSVSTGVLLDMGTPQITLPTG